MMRTVLASAALVAAAYAAGDAVVVNKCSYDVYMANTPASGGGYSAIGQTLSPGGSYSQQYTQLSNGNGWSIKLSKAAGQFGSNILQYEYTFHNDGTIWYDLSEVNGNPWDGNWEITATSGCTPRQAAYRYATDDAYGMQSCADSATITVTLCSGNASGGSSQPPSSPSQTWPATSVPSVVLPTSTPQASTPATGNHGHHTWGFGANKVKAPAGNAILESPAPAAPSTLATTSTPAAWNGPAVTVTNVHVETQTQYVTATAAPAKRHVHHARHPHHRR